MCVLTNRAEERAERLFYLYMGSLRVRYMSTELLVSLYEGWEGESLIREIPAGVIKAELDFRGKVVKNEWCS